MGRRRGATADGAIVMVVWRWIHVLLPLVEVADSEDGESLGANGAPLFRI